LPEHCRHGASSFESGGGKVSHGSGGIVPLPAE
jgi:hypothetical protein